MNTFIKHIVLPVLLLLCSITTASDDGMFVRAVRQLAVYQNPSRADKPMGRINYGAVLKVFPTDRKSGCRKGWVRLENGGFVCSGKLKSAESHKIIPAPEDSPEIGLPYEKYLVKKGGAIVYLNREEFQLRRKHMFLYKDSVLTVKSVIRRGDSRFLVTREGMYAQADNTVKLAPVFKLGVNVDSGAPPGGFVVKPDTPVREKPEDNSRVVGTLKHFEILSGTLSLKGEWVKLPGGGFVRDEAIARFRKPTTDFTPGAGEKWISVDLQEQVLVAWEGNRPMLVVPCSTGLKGNTEPGSYRVRWKRRLQTLRGYGGKLRVEDVQWVMYYIPKRGFAIHTAWHLNFGHPVSHGCVNLPRDDARWLYEWASPYSFPEYSENLHTESEAGTRVIVF